MLSAATVKMWMLSRSPKVLGSTVLWGLGLGFMVLGFRVGGRENDPEP